MQIKILENNGEQVSGYCMASHSIATCEDVDLHDQIADFINDDSEGEYAVGKIEITSADDIPHCYDFVAPILSPAEYRQECMDHKADMARDR